ncbi:MAG: hypothetical protein IJD94_02275 [Clostridia bacterium]|nr:hypothetical protein [Clostridia bacterium]
MLFAHLFWLYYSEERFDRFFILHFSLSACVLALIKGAGIALVFLVLLAMLLDFIFGNPQPLRQIAKERRSSFLVGSALVFLIPLIAYFSWKLYLNLHHIGDFWKTGSAVSPQSLLALITSPQEYQVQTLSNFLYNIRTSFNLGRIPISFVRYPAVFLIVSIFAGVCAGNLRRGTIAGISLSFSYCMYVASVLITYLLLFSPGEAVGNASFRRYMNTQTLACCMCSLVLLLNPAVLSRRTSQPLPDIEILGLRFIPGAVLPALLALSFPFLSGSASTAIQLYCNARADMQFAIQHRADLSFFERKANEIENKEARIWYIHQTCNGDRYYVARMLAAPIRFNMREFSLAASNESMDNPYSVIKTLRQWSDELASYDYVYCDQITDTFITDYGDLFENRDDISAHAFYQVIPAGNGEDFVQLRLLERE